MTADEYRLYNHALQDSKKSPVWLRWLFRALLTGSILESIFLGHYAFAAFLVTLSLAIGLSLSRLSKTKWHDASYEQNRFASTEVEMEFGIRTFKIRTGLNRLTFAVRDVHSAQEFPDFFHLVLHSGFKMLLPKKCLQPEEIDKLNIYHKTAVARSEKVQWQTWSRRA